MSRSADNSQNNGNSGAAAAPDWGESAADYALHAQGFTRQFVVSAVDDAVAALPARIVESNRKKKKISCLDVAAGTGAATFYLAAALSKDGRMIRHDDAPDCQVEILATDSNQKMLAQLEAAAKKDDKAYSNVKIETKVMDMHNLAGVESNSMDLVTMTFGIMFSDNPVQALQEVRRVMAPDGVAILTSWSWTTVTNDSLEIIADQGKIERCSDATVKELDFGSALFMLKLAKQAGIENTSYRYIQSKEGYPMPTAFVAKSINLVPAFAKYGPIDEDRARQFLNDFADGSNEFGPFRLVHGAALCLRIGF